MNAQSEGARLVFYPAFGPEFEPEFTDQYFRAQFYLKCVAERIADLCFVRAPGMSPGALPAYLDPTIPSFAPAFEGRISFCDWAEEETALEAADYILHWKDDAPIPERFAGKVIKKIDRHCYVEECQEWLTLTSQVGGAYSYRAEESQAKFRALVARYRDKRCYVFGTGPSLSLAAQHDYSQGVTIACNSMVKNTALLERMRPPLIVAADPIFHAGASVYAAEFRATLFSAMRRFDCHFLCNQRDLRVFEALAPPDLRERLIGGPADWGVAMNTNVAERFVFTACPNILTLFLLPLAAVFSTEEVFIAGCDGRPLVQNDYFWRHDESVQFSDKMSAIQEAHPSFFDISYDDYYFLHCETVASWISGLEAIGRRVVNMTPSFIPALRARYQRLVDVAEGEAVTERISLSTKLRMRWVFFSRQRRAFRHSVLPRWKRAARRALGLSPQ